MGLLKDFVALPHVQVLMPITLLLLAGLLSLPPLTVHVLFHPFKYIVSAEPLDKRIKALRQKFFYYTWRVVSPIFNSGQEHVKKPLLARASGTVLEIGAGVGSHLNGYIRSKVNRLILVEPNASMHTRLRQNANAAGFYESDGSLLLLGCGGAVTDETPLSLAGVGTESVDSVVSIHVLCGIPGHAQAIEMYRRLLRPEGLFIFYEHVKSTESYTAAWQNVYTSYIWPVAFDGCCMNRQTGALIAGGPSAVEKRPLSNGIDMVSPVTGWDENVKRRWKEFHINMSPESLPYSCLPDVVGWAIKA